MRNFAAAMLTAAPLACIGLPGFAQDPLSCDVQEIRSSGENTEIIYSMNCRPVAGGGVTGVCNGVNGEIEVIHGAGRSAFGGGPAYILRFSNRPVEDVHYGPPLDGNIGAVGR
jgi:hypothetical protein